MPRYEQRPSIDYSTKICPLTLLTGDAKLCATDGCAAWKGGDWSGCTIISFFGVAGYNNNIQAKRASLEIRRMAVGYAKHDEEGGGA